MKKPTSVNVRDERLQQAGMTGACDSLTRR